MKNNHKTYTITVIAENEPGVLYRIADLFLRRKINLESLTVSENKEEGMSRFTIVVRADHDLVEKVSKQLYRIIEITKVWENTNEDLVFCEVAFYKINCANAQKRNEIANLAAMCKARVSAVKEDYVILRLTATEDKVDTLYNLVKPYGIIEFVRSGRIAMTK